MNAGWMGAWRGAACATGSPLFIISMYLSRIYAADSAGEGEGGGGGNYYWQTGGWHRAAPRGTAAHGALRTATPGRELGRKLA